MKYLPTALCAASALLLGGCQTVFDLVGVEQPLTAQEAVNYNGNYQGSIRQTADIPSGCPAEHGEKVIMVGDGVLWYAYSPTQFFTAPIRYDGAIAAESGTAVFAGQITGNHLAATIKSPTCQTSLSMDYIYNHS